MEIVWRSSFRIAAFALAAFATAMLFACSPDAGNGSARLGEVLAGGGQDGTPPVKPSEHPLRGELAVAPTPIPESAGRAETRHGGDLRPIDLEGSWQSADPSVDFTLWLVVEDSVVSGQYCAVNEDASRVDCGTEDEIGECFVRGPLPADGELLLEVVSCYNGWRGQANLRKAVAGEDAELLEWRLAEPAGEYGRDHLAPAKVLLVRSPD